MKAIILAAGVGRRLRNYTDEPKTLLEIGGESLLHRYLRGLEKIGICDVVIVVGYRKEKIIAALEGINFNGIIKIIENEDFKEGSILSLWSARDEIETDVLIMDGDVYFEDALLNKITLSKKTDYFLLDTTAENDGESVMVGFDDEKAVALDRGLNGEFSAMGEMVGFIKLSRETAEKLIKIAAKNIKEGKRDVGYEFLIPDLFDQCSISYEFVDGLKWIEIDFVEDVKKAKNLINK